MQSNDRTLLFKDGVFGGKKRGRREKTICMRRYFIQGSKIYLSTNVGFKTMYHMTFSDHLGVDPRQNTIYEWTVNVDGKDC